MVPSVASEKITTATVVRRNHLNVAFLVHCLSCYTITPSRILELIAWRKMLLNISMLAHLLANSVPMITFTRTLCLFRAETMQPSSPPFGLSDQNTARVTDQSDTSLLPCTSPSP
jgi:hypothetical protein